VHEANARLRDERYTDVSLEFYSAIRQACAELPSSSEAQNAEKCLAQRRPFMQTASDRPALGTAGGWEAGGGPAAYVDENSSTVGGITGGPTATDSSSKTTVTDVSQSSTRTTRPTTGPQSGASTSDDGAVVIGGKSGVAVALALVLLGLMLL